MLDLVSPESLRMNSAQLARVGDHMRRRYVDAKKLPGSLVLVARGDQVCYLDVAGHGDLERNTPLAEDTIFRIYSMTKPVTSLALMTLYEKGLFSLDDPVHRFIPSWKNIGVYKAGSYPQFETVPCHRAMTVGDLLTHTSGLTYDFLRASNVDHAYRKMQIAVPRPGYTLKSMVDQLAQLPLEYVPGERWNYSCSTDVVGHLVEVLSGQSLPEYLRNSLFEPLGMIDTAFEIAPEKLPRFASCYERSPDKKMVLMDDGQNSRFADVSFYSGGGGLVSTAADYYRFCRMLLNGGTLDGKRIIGPRTLDFMTRNHLPDGKDMSTFATGSFSETIYQGVGFGLGFANKVDPVRNGSPASKGTYFWGGLASTLFWVDPREELIVIFMTQLVPSSTFNLRGQLEALIYAALD